MIRYNDVGVGDAPLAYRLRSGTQPAIVMLHGLGGDETSMWSLESALLRDTMIVAPRGPYEQRQGGYAWLPVIKAWPPTVEEFAPSVAQLEQLLDSLDLDRERMILMGFSNGAAMSFASAMTPMRVQPAGIIVGAGHLPQGDLDPLRGIPIYWGHGQRDTFIPIDVARADVRRLEAAGADVTYCEADVGHKLGVDCLHELKGWMRSNFTVPERGG